MGETSGTEWPNEWWMRGRKEDRVQKHDDYFTIRTRGAEPRPASYIYLECHKIWLCASHHVRVGVKVKVWSEQIGSTANEQNKS
jgi:hypothetical protein